MLRGEIAELMLTDNTGVYKDKLFELYSPMVDRFVDKHKHEIDMEEDDLRQELYITVYELLGRFSGNYSVGTCIGNGIRNKFNSLCKRGSVRSLPWDMSLDNIMCDDSLDELFMYEDKGYIRDILKERLNKMELFVVDMYFGFDGQGCYTYREIADILSVSCSRVQQILEKALRKLRCVAYRFNLQHMFY